MARADSNITTPDASRRRFMAVAAAASAVSAYALAAAAMPLEAHTTCSLDANAPDPAFALIEAKRAADVAHGALSEAEERYGFDSEEAAKFDERAGSACHAASEAGWALATTSPLLIIHR